MVFRFASVCVIAVTQIMRMRVGGAGLQVSVITFTFTIPLGSIHLVSSHM